VTRQWVVVTGAASGIGEGIARGLSQAGYGIVLVDFDRDGLARVGADLPESVTLACDLTDPGSHAQLRDAARSVETTWGLVNCAGISQIKHFLLTSDADWTRILRVNLEGTVRASSAVGEVLAENGGGAIVNISSISGIVPAPLQAPYAASKAGVIGFTTGLAFDLGPLNVTVNAVSPGIVRTPIWDAILTKESAETGVPADDIFAAHVRPIPAGRPQTSEDIAQVCAFLLSPAGRNISGETIKVTGGMTTVNFDFHAGADEYRSARVGA
jgi:meso-butanediol dehydrogenase / (S,S)-butanediol dehydrogenase / diacetyl reductase